MSGNIVERSWRHEQKRYAEPEFMLSKKDAKRKSLSLLYTAEEAVSIQITQSPPDGSCFLAVQSECLSIACERAEVIMRLLGKLRRHIPLEKAQILAVRNTDPVNAQLSPLLCAQTSVTIRKTIYLIKINGFPYSFRELIDVISRICYSDILQEAPVISGS